MSKHTELSQLLKALRHETHALAALYHTDASQGRAEEQLDAVDVAEKRIFSFFDSLQTMLIEELRKVDNLREQRDAIALKRDALEKQLYHANSELAELRAANKILAAGLTAPACPMPAPNVPFNEADAAAGEPVQVLFDGVWRDVKYIGKGEIGHIVEQRGTWARMDLSYWGVDKMRMKQPTTRQVQMFANVYSTSRGVVWGTLKMEQSPARTIRLADQVTFNQPVIVTVAE